MLAASRTVWWAPARFHSGLSFQPGWVVVRPGWVAFHTTEAPTHLVSGMLWAASGFVRIQLGKATYDFDARAQRPDFDESVVGLAARVIRATEGDVVRSPRGLLFRADEQTWIAADKRPPEELLSGWRAGKVRFDVRATARLFAIITAIPFAFGAVGGTIAYIGGADTSELVIGVGFWWSLVVFGWIGFFVAWRRQRLTTD